MSTNYGFAFRRAGNCRCERMLFRPHRERGSPESSGFRRLARKALCEILHLSTQRLVTGTPQPRQPKRHLHIDRGRQHRGPFDAMVIEIRQRDSDPVVTSQKWVSAGWADLSGGRRERISRSFYRRRILAVIVRRYCAPARPANNALAAKGTMEVERTAHRPDKRSSNPPRVPKYKARRGTRASPCVLLLPAASMETWRLPARHDEFLAEHC